MGIRTNRCLIPWPSQDSNPDLRQWGSWGAPKPCSRSHTFHRTAVPVLGDAAEPCSPGTCIVLWQPSACPAGSLPEHGGHRVAASTRPSREVGQRTAVCPQSRAGTHTSQGSLTLLRMPSAGQRWRGGRQFDWLLVPTDGVTAPGGGTDPAPPTGPIRGHLSSSDVKSVQQYFPQKCYRQNDSTWRLEAV